MSTVERLTAERDQARGDLDSLIRELAVICGGPGQPREGETRVAYWLRRVGELAAKDEELLTHSAALLDTLKEAAGVSDWKELPERIRVLRRALEPFAGCQYVIEPNIPTCADKKRSPCRGCIAAAALGK